MGTRADFYVGIGEQAEWLGSIAMDGYPDGHVKKSGLIIAESETAYRALVDRLLASVNHSTRPEQGWPWPWDDSRTTDYAYAWTNDGVAASCFGHPWFDPRHPQRDDEEEMAHKDKVKFPNMATRKNVAWDRRSGLIILGGAPD